MEKSVQIIIAILVLFMILSLIIYFVRMIQSGNMHNFLKFLIVGLLVILVYWFFGGYLFTIYNKYIYLEPLKNLLPGDSIEWMDTIWYTIFFITIMVFIAFIVKTLKEFNPRANLAISTFGLVVLLLVYTCVYYIILAHKFIWALAVTAAVLWIILLIIILLSRYLFNLGIDNIIFRFISLFFGISSLFLFICLIFLVKQLYDIVYERMM